MATAESADYHRKKEKLVQLKSFSGTQKEWAEGRTKEPAVKMMVSQAQTLTELGAGLDPSLQTFTAVVGDQSAGKTIVVMSLLGQVVLDVKNDIGTTVRTYVKQTCNMGQQDDYECSIDYTRQFTASKLPPDEMLKTYQQLSEWNKTNIPGKIDTENICQVHLSTKTPSLGVQVMDHAGFAPDVLEKVQESFNQTLQDYFTGHGGKKSCKNASVLLCHAMGKPASEGFFPRSHALYNKVGKGQMFVAITKSDRLCNEQAKQDIAKNMLEKNWNKIGNSKVRVTPAQILQFLKNEIVNFEYADKEDNYSKHRALPDHVQVFFVSSYKGSIEKLMELEPGKRFDKFLNDEDDGQIQTEDAFRKALYDVKGWEKCGVELVVDSDGEEVSAQIGMQKLLRALQKKSADGYLDMAEQMLKKYEKNLKDVEVQLRQEESSFMPDVVSTTKMVFQKYVQTYTVLAACDLLNPDTSGMAAQQNMDKQVDQEMKNVWDSQKKKLGWTLDEELKISEGLERKGHFPPRDQELQEENWEQKFDELLPYCVQRRDQRKERSLSSLIRRFEQEFALRSCLVKIPPVDPEELQKDSKVSPSQFTGSLQDALMNHIQNMYAKIYRGGDNDGGNTYVAMRVALACLLHGQLVMNIMKEVPHFGAVLGKKGAAGKLQTDFNLVTCLKAASRVQNKSHPGRWENSQMPEESLHSRCSTTLEEMVANVKLELEGEEAFPKRGEAFPTSNPFDDVCSVVVAHFFDAQFERLEKSLDQLSRKISLCSPAYVPLSHHFGALFVHQDEKFLDTYREANPMDHYPKKFILPDKDACFEMLLNEVLRVSGKAATSAVASGIAGAMAGGVVGAAAGAVEGAVSGVSAEVLGTLSQPVQEKASELVEMISKDSKEKSQQSRPLLNMFRKTTQTPDSDAASTAASSDDDGAQKYDDHEGALFQLGSETKEAVRTMNCTSKLDYANRARLLSSMIKSNKLPDTIRSFENSNQTGRFDQQWLEFVSQRHLTCSVKRTLDDVLEVCTSLLYEFMHPAQKDIHMKQVMNRYESLCLGYQYPYLSEDRPVMYRFRDHEDVIQFLYNNKHEILQLCNTRRGDANVPIHQPRISKFAAKIQHSPIFKRVVKLASGSEEEQAAADTLVERLYAAWEKTLSGQGGGGKGPESEARKDITEIILGELMPLRYKEHNEPDKHAKWLAQLKQKYRTISNMVGAVRSFRDFISKNGNNLESDSCLRPFSWSVQEPGAIVAERTQVCKPPSCWAPVQSAAMETPDEHDPDDDLLDLVM